MRIIGGKHKGRALARPPSTITRPTMDRVRESIYNMLAHTQLDGKPFYFEGSVVLDAFAGSGALALECISRGSSFAYLFDRSQQPLKVIRSNIESLGEQNTTKLIKADATKPPKAPQEMDLVLLDPPFGRNLTSLCLPPLHKNGWIGPDTLIMAEIAAREDLNLPDGFKVIKEKVYGTTQMFFIRLDVN